MSLRKLTLAVLTRLALVAFSTLLVLVPAELFCRTQVRLQPPMAESDPVTIYRLRPNLEARDRSPGDFSVVYHTNSRGFRGPEVRDPRDGEVLRVLGVGDSFTFGIGVEDDETYLRRLEAELRASPVLDDLAVAEIEVVNAGTAGWGTGHALAFLEDRGWDLEPDLLVLGFFANDPLDDRSAGLFRVEDGTLVRPPRGTTEDYFPERQVLKRLPFYETLAHNSALLALVRTQYMNWRVRQRESPATPSAPRVSIENPPLELTRYLLREIGRQADERGIPWVVLLIPRPWTADTEPAEVLARYEAHRLLCAEEGVSCLDATSGLLEAGVAPEELYYQNHDHHWTPTPHRLAAESLARWIEDRLSNVDTAPTEAGLVSADYAAGDPSGPAVEEAAR